MVAKKKYDIIGHSFGKLVVIENVPNKNSRFICQCDCGETTEADAWHLVSGFKKSCGCSRRLDISGKKFNRLTVIKFVGVGKGKSHQSRWLCKCDCGNDTEARGDSIVSGKIKSCGCLSFDSAYKGIGDLSGSYWSNLIKGAKERNLPFLISKEYAWELWLKQKGICVLTGKKLVLVKSYDKFKHLQTASLDRIDSSLGYIEGNVQWVHWRINNMKSNMIEEEFIGFCKDVANYIREEKTEEPFILEDGLLEWISTNGKP